MRHAAPRLPRSLTVLLGILVVLGLSTVTACKRKSTAPAVPAGGSTHFTGTIAGASVSGSIKITVATASPSAYEGATRSEATVTATGSVVIGSDPEVPLTGTYDTSTHALSITGGGYTFVGTYTAGTISGTFTGPSAVSGGFTVQTDPNSTVAVYIGTFTSTSGGASGNFNLVVNGTVITGLAVATDGTEVPLNGTLTNGTDVSIVNPGNGAAPPLATGTLNTFDHTMSGTFDDSAGNSGNWAGALAQ